MRKKAYINSTRILKPTPLKEGATIGIFSPSEPLTEERLRMVENGAAILRSNGFNVKFASNYDSRNYYMAGLIEQRLNDIHQLLIDPEVDALITSWGGKSCCQLLPFLDYSLIRKALKPVMGFSDGGVIVNAILAKAGLVSFYGPNVVGKLNATQYADLRSLKEDGLKIGTNLLENCPENEALIPGSAEGILVGGNLSTFVNAIAGTIYEPTFSSMILLLESGPKTSQELDTLFWGLRLNSCIRRIKGIVIGDCEIKNDSKWGNRPLNDILLYIFKDLNIPILRAPFFGHKDLANPIFPLGCAVKLDVKKGLLILNESVVGNADGK